MSEGVGPRGREKKLGRARLLGSWAGLVWGLGLSFGSLFLTQTKFEFNLKFEFKPHSNN